MVLDVCREWWGWWRAESMCCAIRAITALPQVIVLGGTVGPGEIGPSGLSNVRDFLIFVSMRPS